MSRTNDDLVELSLVLFHTSERAFLVGDSGERDKAVWLAIASCDMDPRPEGAEDETISGFATTRQRPIHKFLVPEWMAHQRGLL